MFYVMGAQYVAPLLCVIMHHNHNIVLRTEQYRKGGEQMADPSLDGLKNAHHACLPHHIVACSPLEADDYERYQNR